MDDLFLWNIWTVLTQSDRVMHICVSKLNTVVSDNGLAPGQCQAIIWTNAGILSIGPLGTNISETTIEIYIFSFKKMHLKMSSGNWRPFLLGFNVLINVIILSGVFKPEDPRITEESRALWLRSYMEEKWRLMGRDPDNIPDVAMEKFEVEMQMYEIVSLDWLQVSQSYIWGALCELQDFMGRDK